MFHLDMSQILQYCSRVSLSISVVSYTTAILNQQISYFLLFKAPPSTPLKAPPNTSLHLQTLVDPAPCRLYIPMYLASILLLCVPPAPNRLAIP